MLFSSFDLRESAVAMLSLKSRRRMSSPPPASRARSPECSASRAQRGGSSIGLPAPAGREQKFSSLQTIENKRNRIGIPPNPHPRPSLASFAGNRGAAKFSYPQPLEKARNGEGISQAALLTPLGQAFRRTPRPTPAISSLRVGRGQYELAMTESAFIS